MLDRLKMTNFMLFDEAEIAWSPGINVVVGENGTGKSQLLKLGYSVAWTSAAMGRSFRQTKEEFQKRLADKLVATARPESLGRLVSRKQGRNRCDIEVSFDRPPGSDFSFSFATNARSEVKLEKMPAAYAAILPVFVPTREMLSFFPGFASSYEERHLEFDETYYDLAKALDATLLRKHSNAVSRMIGDLESVLGGKIRQDAGRFYLYPDKTGVRKLEIPLVAEGMRKLALLAYLLMNGTLRVGSTLFWDEPESNLNPRLIALLARVLSELAAHGLQVVVATHSLFLLREIALLQRDAKRSVRYVGLSLDGESVKVEQSDLLEGIGTLVLLDEELNQSDRYLAAEGPDA